MSTARRPYARHALAAALAVGALLLAACGNQTAGSAATYGDSRITDQQLSAQVQEVLTATGQPVDSSAPELTQQALTWMIRAQLIDELAAREAVAVTQGDIDAELAAADAQAGGREAVEQGLAQKGIAPSQIEAYARFGLQIQGVGSKLAPQGTADEQGNALFDAAVALSDELDVTVSPRYGTWDRATLSLGPVPDDLSVPPAVG